MNICIVSENFEIGGLQRVISELGENLNEHFDVFYYSLFPGASYYENDIVVSRPNNNSFIRKKIRGGKIRVLNKLKKNYNPRFLFKKNIDHLVSFTKAKNIDILILNGGVITSFSPDIKKGNSKVKIISWQHNEAKVYFDVYYKNIIDAYKSGLANSDAIVCLTNNDKKEFGKFNVNTFQINNGVYIKEKVFTNKNFYLNTVKLGFCSRYSIEQKGLDYLVQITKLLPKNYNIFFAGTGDTIEIEKFKQLITENDLEDRIHLLGALKDKELEDFYSGIDIFISTSRWEGFGLVLIEAMAQGKPVVSFDNSGPNMILGNGTYGILIKKYDTEQFAKEVISLCSNPKELERYSILSERRAKDFSIDKMSNQWEKLINNLLENQNEGR